MSQQLSLFDVMRAPPLIVPVQPDGPVVQGDPDETLELPNETRGWRGCPTARIQLHREPEGWMWGTQIDGASWGSGYKVGRKWGKFASSREDALHYAAKEIADRLERRWEPDTQVERRIKAWIAQWL